MSFHVAPIATANHFIGLASTAQREEVTAGVIDEDSRRNFWIKHMLPTLTEPFLDTVISSEHRCRHFTLEGLDDPNSPPKHIIAFQSFAHLCVPLRTVAARHMPWQFRVILHKDTRAVLATSYATDAALRSDVFEKAGWYFWITDTGFCIAPKPMCEELSDISAMHAAWLKTRNDFELPASFKAAPLLSNAVAQPHPSALPAQPVLQRLHEESGHA